MGIIPAAITRINFNIFVRAAVQPLKHKQEFIRFLSNITDKEYVYSFSSLMRASAYIFSKLSEKSDRKLVILPRYSCPSFSHGAMAANLGILYVDVDPTTMEIVLEDLYKLDTTNVLCILSANLFGFSSELDRIDEFCKSRNITHIVGADYGLLSEYQGHYIGKWGDIAIFNFQEGKVIPIGGAAFASRVSLETFSFPTKFRNFFRNFFHIFRIALLSTFSRPIMYELLRKTLLFLNLKPKAVSMEDTIRKTIHEFDFEINDRDWSSANFNLTLAQCAIGGALLKDVYLEIEKRKEVVERLKEIFTRYDYATPLLPNVGLNKIQYVRFPIMFYGKSRDDFIQYFFRAGYELSSMYNEHGMKIDPIQYPGSAQLQNRLLTVPCNVFMTDRSIDRFAKLVEGYKE